MSTQLQGPPETARQTRSPGGPLSSPRETPADALQETKETSDEAPAVNSAEPSTEFLGAAPSDGFAESSRQGAREPSPAAEALTLAALPVGARLVLRCRKDWRDATVAFLEPGRVVLSVNSPTGHSYRVRRPPDSLLFLDGYVPVLGAGTPLSWRAGRVRYDERW